MYNRSSRAGVTLSQVVIALAILAVIAVIVAPVFQHVPGNSPRASCQSNLKQLGLALTQYEQDADEQTPPGVNAAGNGWAGQIYPFVKSTGVYRCPEDRQDGHYVSYAENRNTVRQPLTEFADPAETVQLYETTTPNCDPSTAETVSATGLSAPQDSKRHDRSTFRSTYALNFLAADGHVKYLKPGQVSSGPDAARPKAGAAFEMTFAVK